VIKFALIFLSSVYEKASRFIIGLSDEHTCSSLSLDSLHLHFLLHQYMGINHGLVLSLLNLCFYTINEGIQYINMYVMKH